MSSLEGSFTMGTAIEKLALITGASSGIGFELAREFAKDGYDLLIASDEARIDECATELQEEFRVNVEAIQVDLSSYQGVETLCETIRANQRSLDAAAINFGVSLKGDFEKTSLENELKMIRLNVESTVHLAKEVVGKMVVQGGGKILFVGLIASAAPALHLAVYNGTRSFVSSFAESLKYELRGKGVTIKSFMPGPIYGTKADVARASFETLMGVNDSVFMKPKLNGLESSSVGR